MSPMRPLISAVLCTYNRRDLLDSILQDLCHQTLALESYEIVVVDNNSSDGTKAVVAEHMRSQPNLKYCFEPAQGIAHARNRGVQEAQGIYIAYADDDCRVPPDWLKVAKHIIDDLAPAVFGGPYFAIYNTPKPNWFKDDYGSYHLGDNARRIAAHEYLHAGNLFIQKAILAKLGGFNPELGHRGQKLWYGEEVALVRQIRATLPEAVIYYDPALKVQHLVAPQKLNLRWHVKQRFVDGRSWLITFDEIRPKHIILLHLPLLAGLMLARSGLIAWAMTGGMLCRDRQKYPHWQNYVYEKVLKHVGGIGLIYEKVHSLLV